jgi:hypothetical protein
MVCRCSISLRGISLRESDVVPAAAPYRFSAMSVQRVRRSSAWGAYGVISGMRLREDRRAWQVWWQRPSRRGPPACHAHHARRCDSLPVVWAGWHPARRRRRDGDGVVAATPSWRRRRRGGDGIVGPKQLLPRSLVTPQDHCGNCFGPTPAITGDIGDHRHPHRRSPAIIATTAIPTGNHLNHRHPHRQPPATTAIPTGDHRNHRQPPRSSRSPRSSQPRAIMATTGDHRVHRRPPAIIATTGGHRVHRVHRRSWQPPATTAITGDDRSSTTPANTATTMPATHGEAMR